MKIDKSTDLGPQFDWLAGAHFEIEVCYHSKWSPSACTKTPTPVIPYRFTLWLHMLITYVYSQKGQRCESVTGIYKELIKLRQNIAQFCHVHISWHSLNPFYIMAVTIMRLAPWKKPTTRHWMMCSYFYRYSWRVSKWSMWHTFALIKGHCLYLDRLLDRYIGNH